MTSETGFDPKLFDRFPTSRGRGPKASSRSSKRIWAAPNGWRRLTVVNNNYVGLWYVATAFLFFLLAGVLALVMRAQLALPLARHPAAGNLQPVLHHARHGDDVPVRRPDHGGDRGHAAAADAGGARPAVPAALGLRLLGLFRRRAVLLRFDLLRARAERRLVHVSAADQHHLFAGDQRRFLAARDRLHRDFRRLPARSRSSSACSRPARRA